MPEVTVSFNVPVPEGYELAETVLRREARSDPPEMPWLVNWNGEWTLMKRDQKRTGLVLGFPLRRIEAPEQRPDLDAVLKLSARVKELEAQVNRLNGLRYAEGRVSRELRDSIEEAIDSYDCATKESA